jgi:hypothetical protein
MKRNKQKLPRIERSGLSKREIAARIREIDRNASFLARFLPGLK